MDLAPPRGTRDFFPEDLRLRQWLFGHFREVSRLYGFEEYDAPVVESAELYTRKAGEEIVQQLYDFRDKGDRHLALRPEMTPSLARMVLQRGKSLSLPLKWYSIPQCWRYERMTRGRRREHYQWNLDIFGVAGVEAEAELLAALTTFFTRVGLGPQDVGIKISNRKIWQRFLGDRGVPMNHFARICIELDKRGKRSSVESELSLTNVLIEIELENLAQEINTLLSIDSLDDAAGLVGEDNEGIQELRQLFALGGEYGYGEWLRFDVSLMRGLAYYTGIVFEAFDQGAALRAICGGGRYDRLLSTFGGENLPACGLGFGDAVIVELLKDKGLLPELPEALDDVVFSFDPSLRQAAMQVANHLRQQGRSVDLILEDRKLRWAFRHADSRNASRLVLLAPDEWAAGKVRVKDLKTGEERDIPLEDL